MSDFIKLCEEYGIKRIESIHHNKDNPKNKIKWWESKNEFPFTLNLARPFWIEYVVTNFESELGFFVDILGMKPNAIGTDYTVLSNPKNEFYFGFWKESDTKKPTQPETITIGFLIDEIEKKFEELKNLGIQFISDPQGYPKKDDPLLVCRLNTPNEIPIELWGMKG